MFFIPRKLGVILLTGLLPILPACGADESESNFHGSIISAGNDLGGSLSKLDVTLFLDRFQKAEFYRLDRPVGLGIKHQFIGVVITDNKDKRHFFTTGYSHPLDDKLLQSMSLFHGSRIRYIGVIREFNIFKKLKEKIDRRFSSPWRKNTVSLTTRYILAPLLGRPCAVEAKAAERLIRAALEKE